MLDIVGCVAQQAGDEDLAVGQLDVLPDPPLVHVSRVGDLEGVGAGVDHEHVRRDLSERQVMHARTVVEPVAGVQPDLVLGNPAQRVIERLDVLACRAVALGHG